MQTPFATLKKHPTYSILHKTRVFKKKGFRVRGVTDWAKTRDAEKDAAKKSSG
jgi:hypothetical protein